VTDSLLSELLTAAQVAELLQLKRTTVDDYARRGLLPSIKLGRHSRFVRSDVEAALARLRTRSPTQRSSGHIRDTFAPHRTAEKPKTPPLAALSQRAREDSNL
jgi:excisionase family DNA binding protein